MSYNEHTKQKQQTKVPSKEYRDNWDLIFRQPQSLDAAYQRSAIDAGFTINESALFPENVEYYKVIHARKSS